MVRPMDKDTVAPVTDDLLERIAKVKLEVGDISQEMQELSSHCHDWAMAGVLMMSGVAEALTKGVAAAGRAQSE